MLCYTFVMSYHVMSCHVMSCHVMSCHVMSCHVMSCHVMLCHVISCRTWELLIITGLLNMWSCFEAICKKFNFLIFSVDKEEKDKKVLVKIVFIS